MARPHRCRVAWLAGLLVPLAVCPAWSQPRLAFIGVALDRDTRQADRKLLDYLYQKATVTFAPEELEYERVVERLVNWRREDGFFVARATPYVYVVAEMLGADLEILAAYASAATGAATYHSYFVVNRRSFTVEPTVLDLERFLREGNRRARFVYHNQFSTSSYFLPSLYLRSRRVFNMPEPTESLVAVTADRIQDGNTSKLVELVASGEADLAAVWDATKARYAGDSRVRFIQLPTRLPNDLLICSASLDRGIKDRLRSAVRAMGPSEIDVGDFGTWKTITEVADARQALGELRALARERAYPVTVEIRLADDGSAAGPGRDLVEAARQAVRLSGSEFVLFDQDYHQHVDFAWTLQPIHDGAVVLRSAIAGSDLPSQVFRLSFRDSEDLTRRLVSSLNLRLHRVRYVWPYSTRSPIVIRDMAFSLPVGSVVKVQRVTWLDPERNRFRAGPLFDARIRTSGFYRYELDPDDFGRAGERQDAFDPMSNTSYRVILVRPSEERLVFRVVTTVLLALLVAAAAAAAWDLARGRRTEATSSGV